MPNSSKFSACLAALNALDEAIKARREPMPDGWFCAADVEREAGISASTASHRCAAMHQSGIVERRRWLNEDGHPVFIYRLKPADVTLNKKILKRGKPA